MPQVELEQEEHPDFGTHPLYQQLFHAPPLSLVNLPTTIDQPPCHPIFWMTNMLSPFRTTPCCVGSCCPVPLPLGLDHAFLYHYLWVLVMLSRTITFGFWSCCPVPSPLCPGACCSNPHCLLRGSCCLILGAAVFMPLLPLLLPPHNSHL
jgi:hypothetical protein